MCMCMHMFFFLLAKPASRGLGFCACLWNTLTRWASLSVLFFALLGHQSCYHLSHRCVATVGRVLALARGRRVRRQRVSASRLSNGHRARMRRRTRYLAEEGRAVPQHVRINRRDQTSTWTTRQGRAVREGTVAQEGSAIRSCRVTSSPPVTQACFEERSRIVHELRK